MTQTIFFRIPIDVLIAVMAFLFLAGSSLSAQSGATGGQGTQATPLPLSGRNGQNGSVAAGQSAVPGTTTSINTINPTVQVQGPFSGSVSSLSKPFSGQLTFSEAIQRGLAFNLGRVGLTQAIRQLHGQSRVARSALLPGLSGSVSETVEQVNLRALGVRFSSPGPGSSPPAIVGPFNFFDLRARLTQTVADLTALNNYRAAKELVRASEFTAQDARDLVVLAVGGAYLQLMAAKARVAAVQAQADTARALFEQTTQKRNVGLSAQIDVNRNEVQFLTQQQRLISLQNDLSKQKINLARLTGLPANDQYEIVNEIPLSSTPAIGIEDALKKAYSQRWDLKAAQAQVNAAEHVRSAARSERWPSISVSADYGAIGTTPSQSHGTFGAVGTLHVPLWQGGRAEGDIEQADAAFTQRKSEFEDLKSQIEAEVRNAYLDVQAATSQVGLAEKNLETAKQTLELTRQRFDAGVTDSLEVVQSQESVATAQLDYINSVFADNLAKLSLARAIGEASGNLAQFLNLP